MEDPCPLRFLLTIPSLANQHKHRPSSPLTPIAPLPSPLKSLAKFGLMTSSLLSLSNNFILTCFGLHSIIFGLWPFYLTLLFLSSDIPFMTHQTIFPRPDRFCCLVFYDLT